jgi:hypothetical protein
MKFLYAAYGITWAVHIIYLLVLTRRFARLREDIKDLERD